MKARNRLRVALVALLAATVSLVGASRADAASIIFDQATTNQGGTLFYSGDGATGLIGTNIVFDQLTASGVPFPATFNCLGCLLNFTTGAVISEGPNTWVFGPGGSFTLTGNIPGVTAGIEPIIFGGLFVGNSTVTYNPTVKTLTFQGFGTDQKHAGLLAAIGLPANAQFGFSNTDISAVNPTILGNGGFTGVLNTGGPNPDLGNADITNNQIFVPEPGTGLLLLLGLGSLVAYRRRKN